MSAALERLSYRVQDELAAEIRDLIRCCHEAQNENLLYRTALEEILALPGDRMDEARVIATQALTSNRIHPQEDAHD